MYVYIIIYPSYFNCVGTISVVSSPELVLLVDSVTQVVSKVIWKQSDWCVNEREQAPEGAPSARNVQQAL